MGTQAENDAYRRAYAGYLAYCTQRGIQPDQNYIAGLGMQYNQEYQYPPPSVLQYAGGVYEIDEMAREADQTNARIISESAKDRENALADREIWAAAYTQAASIGAQADMAYAAAQVEAAEAQAQAAIEAANIAAAASRYSDDTKAQIAREANELERQRLATTEWNRPSDWGAKVGFFRGQTPEQAAALTKYAGGMTFAAPGGTQGAALPQLPGTQPATAAIVGEPGPQGEPRPELASALPGGGVQITPLQAEQARYLRGQLPQMAYGGVVRSQSLDPTQMAGAMIGTPKTVDEYLQRQQRAYRFVSGQQGTPTVGTPITGIQGTVRSPAVNIPIGTPKTAPAAVGAGTAAAGGSTTPASETTPIDQLPFLQYGRAGGQMLVPAFQAWTGERTAPEIGVTTPIPTPWEFNLNQWNNLTLTEQAMWAGLWRRKMMISGETEEELLANAREAINRSAFRGFAPALPQWSR